jgi:hypothetical protein
VRDIGGLLVSVGRPVRNHERPEFACVGTGRPSIRS